MKTSLLAIALLASTPMAMASNYEALQPKYQEYVNSRGDSTPLGIHEWAVSNGYVQDNSRKQRIELSSQDLADIRQQASYGDSTPPAKVVLSTGPRKELTAEDKEYIRFSNSYGDSTPPSFADWKELKRKGVIAR